MKSDANEAQKSKRARGTGYIFRPKNTSCLWAQYYIRGRRVRVSTGETDEKKAERFLRKKIGEVAAGVHKDVSRISYEELREAYYQDYAINQRKSLRHDKEGKPRLDKVVRLNGFFAGYKAAEIDGNLIRKFIAGEQSKGLSNASINRSVSALRRMFNLARREGELRSIPYFPTLKEAPPRSGFFERKDYEALSRALPAHLRVPLGIGYFTAARYTEILSLRWENVDFLANTIALDKTKNGIPRTVPICAELRVLLIEQRAKQQPGCPFVCYKLDRKGRPVPVQSFRKAWYAGCVKAGLGRFEPEIDAATGEPVLARPRYARSKPKAKMIYSGMTFHDLRRSGVRNLIRAGVSRDVARKISGHETDSVFSRYNITSPQDLNEAARKLSEFHNAFGHSSAKTESLSESQVLQ
jgi:integrase